LILLLATELSSVLILRSSSAEAARASAPFSSSSSSSPSHTSSTPWAAVSSVDASLDRRAVRPGDIGSLLALAAVNYVKQHDLIIPNTSLQLTRVVLCNSGLVDKDVFLVVISCYETVAAFNIEPFNYSCYLLSNDVLWCFFLSRNLLLNFNFFAG